MVLLHQRRCRGGKAPCTFRLCRHRRRSRVTRMSGTVQARAAGSSRASCAGGEQPVPIWLASRASVSSSSSVSLSSRHCCSPLEGVRTRTGASFHTWRATAVSVRTLPAATRERRGIPAAVPPHNNNNKNAAAQRLRSGLADWYPLVLHHLLDVQAGARPGRVQTRLDVLCALDLRACVRAGGRAGRRTYGRACARANDCQHNDWLPLSRAFHTPHAPRPPSHLSRPPPHASTHQQDLHLMRGSERRVPRPSTHCRAPPGDLRGGRGKRSPGGVRRARDGALNRAGVARCLVDGVSSECVQKLTPN